MERSRPVSPEEKAMFAAKAEQARAEAKKLAAEAETAEIVTKQQTLIYEYEKRKNDISLASDFHKRVYHFVGTVNLSSTRECMGELTCWSRIDPQCDITVVFQSPGGEVVSGMALYDFLQELRSEGHKITTIARGMAASMAGILLQAGDVRVMGAESWLLIHEGSAGAIGSIGEIEDTVEWYKKMRERILDIFASRSKLSKAQLERKWKRKDWWISSDESLKLGFIDEIR